MGCYDYEDFEDDNRLGIRLRYRVDVRFVIPEAKKAFEAIPQSLDNAEFNRLADGIVDKYSPDIRELFKESCSPAELTEQDDIEMTEDGEFRIILEAERNGYSKMNLFGERVLYCEEEQNDIARDVCDVIEDEEWDCISAEIISEDWDFA